MFFQNNPKLTSFAFSICLALLLVFIGCAEREVEPRADFSAEYQIAADALSKAESAMEEAGVAISFSDIGSLGANNITQILPNPLELAQLEKNNPELIPDAVGSLYEVLDALPGYVMPASVSGAPLSPLADEISEVSNSDIALTHLHLSYLYVITTVGKLVLHGWGPDGQPDTPDDLFFIDVPEDLEGNGYKFRLTDEAQARFDNIDEELPEEYLQEFTEAQRQAILDSLQLLLGAEVRVVPIPAAGIGEQIPQVDLTIYRRDALFHLEQAVEQARAIAPDLEDAFDEFNRVIAEVFAEDLLDEADGWGFTIDNKDEIEARLQELMKEGQ